VAKQDLPAAFVSQVRVPPAMHAVGLSVVLALSIVISDIVVIVCDTDA